MEKNTNGPYNVHRQFRGKRQKETGRETDAVRKKGKKGTRYDDSYGESRVQHHSRCAAPRSRQIASRNAKLFAMAALALKLQVKTMWDKTRRRGGAGPA